MAKHVAIAGVTGAVGTEMVRMLEERNFPVASLRALASSRSVGKTVDFRGDKVRVEELKADSFKGIDIALFSAGGPRSKEFASAAVKAGAVVIDNSSAFRMDPKVPLVVPEVNPEAIRQHQGIIANPNCSTIIMNVPVWPLYKAFGVERIFVATYQAASGAGMTAMVELEAETRAVLEGREFQRTVIPFRYAFNLFPHNSSMGEDGYCEEEVKMLKETRKIFGDPAIRINAFCVRVPVLRAHSEAINIQFRRDVSPEEAYAILAKAPGVQVFEDRKANRWPMPVDASGKGPVLVGRIRRDQSQPNTLDMWVVGDQLLKGAALNAVQIAELL